MRGAIAGWQAMAMAIGVDFFVVVLADSCLLAAGCRRAGDHAAVSACDAAERDAVLPLRSASGTIVGPAKLPCWRCYEAELHRLRGELLLARNGLAASGEALECFGKALQLGRE